LYTEKVTVLKERIININDDYDGDGLSNLEEAYFGTDPYNFDTDGEGISDFDEVKKKNGYFTDPLNPDTDRDGIYDSTEYKLSKNPLQKNENSSVVRTVSSMSQSVTVSVYGDNNLTICPIKVFESDSILLKSIKGVVGNPVEVSLNGYKMDHASITFSYSDSDFKDISEEDNLTIYWVDYKNNKLVPLADDKVSIDNVNNKITGIVSHFSVYIAGPKNLLDIYGNKNVVFAIDESGSMRFYDANFSRRAVVSRFISDMNTQTTKASIVTISSRASTKVPFTSDIELLKQGMENFPPCDSSYTDICDGLVEAENNFDSSSSASKYVILLSDGLLDIGESGDSIVDKARIMAGKNIRIITVALGSKANVGLLTKIAEATGGECFSINNDESLTVDQQNTEIYKVYSKIYDILSWGGSDQNFPYIPDFDGREKPILNITSGPYVVNDPVGISAECSDAYKMVVKIDEPDTDPASATVNYFDDRKNPLVSFNFDLKYEGSYIITAVADYESDAPRQTSKVIYAWEKGKKFTYTTNDFIVYHYDSIPKTPKLLLNALLADDPLYLDNRTSPSEEPLHVFASYYGQVGPAWIQILASMLKDVRVKYENGEYNYSDYMTISNRIRDMLKCSLEGYAVLSWQYSPRVVGGFGWETIFRDTNFIIVCSDESYERGNTTDEIQNFIAALNGYVNLPIQQAEQIYGLCMIAESLVGVVMNVAYSIGSCRASAQMNAISKQMKKLQSVTTQAQKEAIINATSEVIQEVAEAINKLESGNTSVIDDIVKINKVDDLYEFTTKRGTTFLMPESELPIAIRGIVKNAAEIYSKNKSGTTNILKFADGYDIHLTTVEDFSAKTSIGVIGGHNLDEFKKFILNKFKGYINNFDECIAIENGIRLERQHPTIKGISEFYYQLPVFDGRGNYLGYWKMYKNPKTVYDDTISNETILQWGRDAMNEGIRANRITIQTEHNAVADIVHGIAPNGLKFEGFIDKITGEITNFYPKID